MTPWGIAGWGAGLGLAGGAALAAAEIRRRHLDRWLAPFVARSLARRLRGTEKPGEVHLILAIADHFEPDFGGVSASRAMQRVEEWAAEYPKALGGFRDADGKPPQHTFFYPIETYAPEHLDALAGLCRRGYGEVEIHLHHDGDTAENLRETLANSVRIFSERHGLLARRRDDGAIKYGFVHGNWALNNARPDGRWCGVNDEIRVLRETGCYADFTFPSAPSATQPPTVNRLYYATSCANRPRGHDHGVGVSDGPAPSGSLLMIQGPLLLNFGDRSRGVFPRVENGCVQASQPATLARLNLWLKAGIQVPTRPDWSFVKLHAHGAPERDRGVLIGPEMAAFHQALARRAEADPKFHVHYVTAREMYNLVRAAESGWRGSVDAARDFELVRGDRLSSAEVGGTQHVNAP